MQIVYQDKIVYQDRIVEVPVDRQVFYPTMKTTQGQMDVFFSQLPFKCYLPEVASVGD